MRVYLFTFGLVRSGRINECELHFSVNYHKEIILKKFLPFFSPKTEKLKSWQIIDDYLANYPVPRDISTPHAVIYQGLEPSTFIGYFDQWDKKFWDVRKSSSFFY